MPSLSDRWQSAGWPVVTWNWWNSYHLFYLYFHLSKWLDLKQLHNTRPLLKERISGGSFGQAVDESTRNNLHARRVLSLYINWSAFFNLALKFIASLLLWKSVCRWNSYICVCMYMYVYICMYVYIYISDILSKVINNSDCQCEKENTLISHYINCQSWWS